MTQIHPTAIIADGAVVGADTTVGPYSVIGPRVVLGRNNRIGSHVVIDGITSIGDENQIFPFAAVGLAPQDLKYRGEESRLEIGNRNIVREYATLQPGTTGGGMLTSIGDGNLFMASSHVGHDCRIGDGNIFANSAALAGHVTIKNHAIFGGLSAVHQFVCIGESAFIGGGSMVVKDVPPFCMAQGDRAGLTGLNSVGLERRGFSAEDIATLKQLYRRIFIGQGTLRGRVEEARIASREHAPSMLFLDAIAGSERGITLPRRGSVDE